MARQEAVDIKPAGVVPFETPSQIFGDVRHFVVFVIRVAADNQMEGDGIVGRYAIGGAVAAFNYIEVSFTEDLDILVSFEDQVQAKATSLVTLGPILKYMAEKGFTDFRKVDVGRPKDYARIVQFVEAGNFDPEYLRGVLERHNLAAKWQSFCDRFEIANPCVDGLKP